MKGPAWKEVVGVFSGGAHGLRALQVKKRLQKGEDQHRIPIAYRSATFQRLSSFDIELKELE